MKKLEDAAKEIKTILSKYDIAGLVVLHTPGDSRFLLELSPSYSACMIEGDKMKIRARLEDFKGDKKKRNKKLADTNNMLKLMCEVSIDAISCIHDPSELFDKKLMEDKLGEYADEKDRHN